MSIENTDWRTDWNKAVRNYRNSPVFDEKITTELSINVSGSDYYLFGDGSVLPIDHTANTDTLLTGIETQPFESWQQRAMERYEAKLASDAITNV